MELTRNDVRRISDECLEAVRLVLDRNGMQLGERPSTSFDATGFKTRFEAMAPNGDGTFKDERAKAFECYAASYGFEPDDLGKTFMNVGINYEICGLNTRAQKMPILAKRVDNGKVYKFAERTVLLALGREVPSWITGGF